MKATSSNEGVKLHATVTKCTHLHLRETNKIISNEQYDIYTVRLRTITGVCWSDLF